MGVLIEALLVYLPILFLIWFMYAYRARRVGHQAAGILAESEEDGLMQPASLHPIIDASLCLGCGACTAACFPKVETKELVFRDRECLVGEGLYPKIADRVAKFLDEKHNISDDDNEERGEWQELIKGLPEQALESYNNALLLDANDPYTYCSKASAYHKLDQPELALQNADKALQVDPWFTPAMANKSRATALLRR